MALVPEPPEKFSLPRKDKSGGVSRPTEAEYSRMCSTLGVPGYMRPSFAHGNLQATGRSCWYQSTISLPAAAHTPWRRVM